jgi:predicted adenylyl cyclase CyaB
MANKKEIEIKLRIDDMQFFNQLISKMESNCERTENVYQHDVYYSPMNENYMEERYPYKWLRVRYFNDGSAEVCFKHFFPEGAEHHLYCNEYQSKVSEPDAIVTIFSELGMQVVADVEKMRTTYRYNRYLISFDKVKNLGNFVEVEVERVKFNESRERELLYNVLEELALSTYPIDLRGYPYLVYCNSRRDDE